MQLNATARGLLLSCACSAIILTGCETTKEMVGKATEAGKSMISGSMDYDEYTDALIGNTMIDTEGTYAVYYREDGVKIGESEETNGEVVERTWRKDDSGAMCETRFADEKEVCMSEYKPTITKDAGVYTLKLDSGRTLTYRIVAGNARDF